MSFRKAIYKRQLLGINSIVLFLGSRGVGKSYGALKISETLDKTFSIDRVCFDVKNFMSVINELKEEKNYFPWAIFDEAGMDCAARKWLSDANMIISYFTQSSRYTRINICLATPDPSLVDLHLRTLSDFWIVMRRRGIGTVYVTRSNPFGKFTTPTLCNIQLALPSKPLYEAYEKKREQAMSEFYKGYEKELEQKSLQQEKRRKDYLAEARERIEDLLDDNDPMKVDYKKIITTFKVGTQKSYKLKYQLEDLLRKNEL